MLQNRILSNFHYFWFSVLWHKAGKHKSREEWEGGKKGKRRKRRGRRAISGQLTLRTDLSQTCRMHSWSWFSEWTFKWSLRWDVLSTHRGLKQLAKNLAQKLATARSNKWPKFTLQESCLEVSSSLKQHHTCLCESAPPPPQKRESRVKKSPFLNRAPQGKWGFFDSRRPLFSGLGGNGVFWLQNPLFAIFGVFDPCAGRMHSQTCLDKITSTRASSMNMDHTSRRDEVTSTPAIGWQMLSQIQG